MAIKIKQVKAGNISLQETNNNVSIQETGGNVELNQTPNGNISIQNTADNIKLKAPISKEGEKDHAKLENLDYENSGHTGFQKAGDYALRSDIPDTSNFVEDVNYVHTDNNFTNQDKNKLNNATTIEDMTNYIEEHKEELKGEPGENGIDGKDGYTPVKGKDYYTEADKQEMVQLVLDEIPSSEGVSY